MTAGGADGFGEDRHREELRKAPPAPPPPLETCTLDEADLKPVHRACLMLRYVQGMTRADISAATTGLTEMQVKGHLQYALELLRRTEPSRPAALKSPRDGPGTPTKRRCWHSSERRLMMHCAPPRRNYSAAGRAARRLPRRVAARPEIRRRPVPVEQRVEPRPGRRDSLRGDRTAAGIMRTGSSPAFGSRRTIHSRERFAGHGVHRRWPARHSRWWCWPFGCLAPTPGHHQRGRSSRRVKSPPPRERRRSDYRSNSPR